jgi:ribose transport system permease protein
MVCGFLINVPTIGKMGVENYVQAEIGAQWPWMIGLIVAMLVGMLLGAMQGGLIVKSKINPFIISLALISVIRGINMAVTENIYFRKLPQEFKDLSIKTFPASTAQEAGKQATYGIPIMFIFVIIIMVVMWIIYNRTSLGRKLLATGVNRRAADFAGINSDKYITIAHGISGLLCAVAGVLTASKLGAAQTSIGDNWLLYSFAAPILGGTLLSGGKVSIVGTLIGAGIMTVLTTVLALLKLDAFTHQIFIGAILILAFVLNKIREELNKKQDKVLN